jgi:hypothetical protein
MPDAECTPAATRVIAQRAPAADNHGPVVECAPARLAAGCRKDRANTLRRLETIIRNAEAKRVRRP